MGEDGLVTGYQVAFDPELSLLPDALTSPIRRSYVAATPLLQAWFEIMDSTTPERVLDMITDDFRLSILFSTGDKAAEFEGDRAGPRGLPRNREK